MATDTAAQPDQVAAYLAEVRENARIYDVFGEHGHLLVQASERLLGAVEAALARHVAVPSVRLVPCEEHVRWRGALVGVPEFGQEFETENLRVRRACPACEVFDEPYCRNCLNDDGGCQDWPCAEHGAITKALLGTDEASD